jgi:hypothetical protein
VIEVFKYLSVRFREAWLAVHKLGQSNARVSQL